VTLSYRQDLWSTERLRTRCKLVEPNLCALGEAGLFYHFTDGKAEVPRGKATCPKPYSLCPFLSQDLHFFLIEGVDRGPHLEPISTPLPHLAVTGPKGSWMSPDTAGVRTTPVFVLLKSKLKFQEPRAPPGCRGRKQHCPGASKFLTLVNVLHFCVHQLWFPLAPRAPRWSKAGLGLHPKNVRVHWGCPNDLSNVEHQMV
jgi:hypothetical protein